MSIKLQAKQAILAAVLIMACGPAMAEMVAPSFEGTNALGTNYFLGKTAIGTNVPAETLHVVGNSRMDGGLSVDGALRVNAQGDLSMGSYTNGESMDGIETGGSGGTSGTMISGSGTLVMYESGRTSILYHVTSGGISNKIGEYCDNPYDIYVWTNGWNTVNDYGTRTTSSTPIQAAHDAAQSGNMILINSGTYVESVRIAKSLTLLGSGMSNTILQTPLNTQYPLNITSHWVTVKDMTITKGVTGGSVRGIAFPSGGYTDITLENLEVYGLDYGVALELAAITNLTIRNCFIHDNSVGIRTATGFKGINGLTIDNSQVNSNLNGMIVYINSTTKGLLTDVMVKDSTFNDNRDKGMYIESLDNAVFDNITVNNSGWATSGSPAGVELNLKYRTDYSDIVIRNSTFTDCGIGMPSRPALSVLGRNDAPSYTNVPALVTGVTVSNVTISGSAVGIVLGNAVTNAVIIDCGLMGTTSVMGVNGYIDAGYVDARNNYWGAANGPSGGMVDPVTSATANGSGTAVGVANVRFDPFSTSP
jgi:hypothetical protein